ncbi:hypothetical protein [Domibacillus antri]|uniref:hypothetical protein n=1 Tax=Domibacillus antri TaxID=1714264 RepID=UPI000ACCBA46|nr:hypothetical protein [Domibacillus antri]
MEDFKMICPHCREQINDDDHIGITQIHSVVHLYCGSWPVPGEHIINEGTFKQMAKKYF